jgi:hypothetical protein
VLGVVVGMVAGFCNFIPLIVATMDTDDCDEEDGWTMSKKFQYWLEFYSYGFLVVFPATVAEGLACFMCCPCGPLPPPQPLLWATGSAREQIPAVGPTVVGMPAQVGEEVPQHP